MRLVIIRGCWDIVPLSLCLWESRGNRKRCRLFEWSIFLSFQNWHSVIIASRERNSVILREHWQAITQTENWMAILIQQYSHSTQLIFIITVKLEVFIKCTWQFLWGIITAAAVSFQIHFLNATSRKWRKAKQQLLLYKQINHYAVIYMCVCEVICSFFFLPKSFPHYLTLTALYKSLRLTKSRQLSYLWSHPPSFIFPQSLSSSLSPSPSFDLKSHRSDLVRRRLKLWLRVCVIFVTVCAFIWWCVSVWGPEASLVSLPACLPPN